MRGAVLNNKKGQVTVFIIIAILVVVFGVAIYFLFPSTSTTDIPLEENPQAYIQNCVEDTLQENVQLIGLQGGSLFPTFYYDYYGDKIEYLCYTNSYYDRCVKQRPILLKHIEEEIKRSIKTKLANCFNSLEKGYQDKGYEVDLNRNDFNVTLLPKKVKLNIDYTLNVKKESKKRYDSFEVSVDSTMYKLASISKSLVDWEASIGNVDIALYMDLYRDIKFEKKVLSDSSKIYILTDRITNDKFQFASRSVVYPPGVYLAKEGVAQGVPGAHEFTEEEWSAYIDERDQY